MRRTISTAWMSLFTITSNLPGRVDDEGSIPEFQMHRAEQPDLVQADDVPTVPAHEHVYIRDCSERDVKHVVPKAFTEDAPRLVCGGKGECLRCDGQELGRQRMEFRNGDHGLLSAPASPRQQ